MHVVQVIDGLGTGGAERSLAELLPRLDAAGVRATVCILRRKPEGVQAAVEAAGCDVRQLPPGRVARVRALRGVIEEVDADVVHTTLLSATLTGRFAAHRHAPVLTSLVNTPYAPARLADPNIGSRRLALVRLADARTRRLTTHFHAITSAVADAAVRDLGIHREDITVIPRGRDEQRLGVPSPERRARARAALGIGSTAPVIVGVGRQEFQKGHVTLLGAARYLLAERPDLLVLVCGRAGAATPAIRAAAAPLGSAVRLLGHRDDVPDILAAADVFAFPSRFEGLGGSVLEAMAMQLPIVASDIPAVRETVSDTAVLVPPDDDAALALEIGAVLADSGRRAALGEAARRRFLAHYTLDQVADRMIALYREVAERPR